MRQGWLVTGLGVLAGMATAGAGLGAGAGAQATHAGNKVAGDAAAGETTFQRRCVMCHSLSPEVKIVGPSLYSEMRGPHARTAASVREIVVNGKGQMPPMGKQLTDQEIADVLVYLRKQ